MWSVPAILGLGQYGNIIVMIVFAAFTVISALLFQRWLKGVYSIAGRNYLVCAKCEYDLRGLGHRGECPECGTPFDASKLGLEWEKKLVKNKRHRSDWSNQVTVREKPLPPME